MNYEDLEMVDVPLPIPRIFLERSRTLTLVLQNQNGEFIRMEMDLSHFGKGDVPGTIAVN